MLCVLGFPSFWLFRRLVSFSGVSCFSSWIIKGWFYLVVVILLGMQAFKGISFFLLLLARLHAIITPGSAEFHRNSIHSPYKKAHAL